jgi:hypothetical protein
MKYTIVRELSKLALIGMQDEVLAVHPAHLADRFSPASAHPVKTFTVTPHSDAVTQERMDRAAMRAFNVFAEAYN